MSEDNIWEWWEKRGLGDPCNAVEMEAWEYIQKCVFMVKNPQAYATLMDQLVNNYCLQKAFASSDFIKEVEEECYGLWSQFGKDHKIPLSETGMEEEVLKVYHCLGELAGING